MRRGRSKVERVDSKTGQIEKRIGVNAPDRLVVAERVSVSFWTKALVAFGAAEGG